MQDLLDESACENDARVRCFKYTQTEGATLITKAINLLCVPHCHLIALNSSNGHTLKAVFFFPPFWFPSDLRLLSREGSFLSV